MAASHIKLWIPNHMKSHLFFDKAPTLHLIKTNSKSEYVVQMEYI
jgi:hypothetical protein